MVILSLTAHLPEKSSRTAEHYFNLHRIHSIRIRNPETRGIIRFPIRRSGSQPEREYHCRHHKNLLGCN